MLRRFCHFQVEPTVDEIVGYLLDHGKDSRVIAYLKNCPEDLFPKKWDETLLDRKANPFPYTWEVAASLIEGKKIDPDIPSVAITMGNLVASCVGPEVAGRFMAYCKTIGKFDILTFIKKPKEEITKIEKDNERASLFYAIISSLASYWFAKNKKLTPEKVVQICQGLPAEFSVAFLKMIVKKRTRELTDITGFQKLLTSLGIYFDEI